MKWRTDNPPVTGKYIVETKTPMGNIHRIEATYTPSEKDKTKGTWGFNNQKFLRWLDEKPTAETVMVCIPVAYNNARKVCESVEVQEYNSMADLREQLNKELGVDDDDDDEQPVFFSLTDFMDECNDQYLNLENYFISYVKINNK